MSSDLIGGRFRRDKLLGSGSMGQVWLATDERLQRQVAVKVVAPSSEDEVTVLRLGREARAAAAVQHANVVRVFDFLEENGTSLIVMEYVKGETLADRIDRLGAIPFDEALELAAQICDGLEAAHRISLVHRDLKPANVIITEEGLAKVLDFGIAKRTGHIEATLTQTGAVLGTPQYMAPEQLNGEDIDARADVHAVGLLLIEMLTGRPAFRSDTIAKLMYKIMSEPPDLRSLATIDVPAEVVEIIKCALQKDRDDRWPNARMMAEALRVALYGDVIRSRRTPTPSGLRTIMASDGRATPIPAPKGLTTESPLPATAGAGATVEQAVPRPAKPRRGVLVAALLVVGLVSAAGLSRIIPASSVPSIPDTSAVVQRIDTIPTNAESTSAPAPPTEAELAEQRLRVSFAGAVQTKWRLFSRPVRQELGDRMDALRTEFVVRVDAGGGLADVRPVRVSGVASFDDNAGAALQNVDRIRTGRAPGTSGWTWRVVFSGATVRVRAR